MTAAEQPIEALELQGLSLDDRVTLLRLLDYDSDGEWVLQKDGKPYNDPYTGARVRVNHMIIVPGSVIILEDEPISFFLYLRHHGKTLDNFSAPA